VTKTFTHWATTINTSTSRCFVNIRTGNLQSTGVWMHCELCWRVPLWTLYPFQWLYVDGVISNQWDMQLHFTTYVCMINGMHILFCPPTPYLWKSQENIGCLHSIFLIMTMMLTVHRITKHFITHSVNCNGVGGARHIIIQYLITFYLITLYLNPCTSHAYANSCGCWRTWVPLHAHTLIPYKTRCHHGILPASW